MDEISHLSSGNGQILQVTIPSVISNIIVPLLGLIDITIVDHPGSAAYIDAIAVGGMLFNIICWIFSFLRMDIGGMTSQAYGKCDFGEVIRLLLRPVGIGLFIVLYLMFLRYPILKAASTFIQTSDEVERFTTLYFYICIWGVSAILGLYGFTEWFIGMRNPHFPMYIAITQNIVNVTASLCFVYLLGMEVEGVALGALTAQYAGFFMAFLLWHRYYGRLRKCIQRKGLLQRQTMYRFFQVNRDIFLRTLCLVAVTMYFISAGATQREVALAVNTLLMQLSILFLYIMDGFAYAGETLAGRYIGADNRTELHRTVRELPAWDTGLSIALTLLYGIRGQPLLGLLTNGASAISGAEACFYWVLAVLLAGFLAFPWNNIFIDAAATRRMLYFMFIASASLFIIYYTFHDSMGNHTLWVAFIACLSSREFIQALLARKIIQQK